MKIPIFIFFIALIVGIIAAIKNSTKLTAVFVFLICCFVVTIYTTDVYLKKNNIIYRNLNKTLTQTIFENDSIKSVVIYKESPIFNSKALFSVDINHIVSYDSLTLDSLKMALYAFPKSLYKN